MTGLRFKVGELAIHIVPRTPLGMHHVGCIVEVIEVGPFAAGYRHPSTGLRTNPDKPFDYLCRYDNRIGGLYDYQLRKIDPPAEPASLTRESECEVVA